MNAGVCLFLIFVFAQPAICFGASSHSTRELAEVQAKMRQVGADVRELASEKNAQIDQLKRLEKQYGEQVNALNAIKSEVKRQEQVLQDVRGKITVTQQDIQHQRLGLEGLIKSAYVIGNQNGLNVLLNQRDPALSGRMLVYYDYIGKARLQKMQSIGDDLRSLRQLEAQKDTEAQLLQVSLEKKQQEANALLDLKERRQQLLARINDDFALKRDQLVQLIHDEKKLESLVASLQKTDDNVAQAPVQRDEAPPLIAPNPIPSAPVKKIDPSERREFAGKAFAELQGQLPWPVQGGLVQRFGSRRFETTWDGAVIGAREGADIHAIADGRVAYADWLRGYGLMLIVDHGKGYMSLYAFNQSLHKSVGELVRAGETVASVGRSGGRSEAALYFGIRKKGRPVDPEQWCRKPGKG